MADDPQLSWQGAVGALGEDDARAFFKRQGIPIPGDKQMDEELPALAVDPNAVEGGDGGSGADSLAVPAGVGNDLQRQFLQHQQRVDDERKRQFEAAQQQLQQQRMGPSLSERLYALSAAFASPTQTRGFGGMMANVMPVLGKGAEAERLAEESRAQQLLALRQKYSTDQLTDEGSALTLRLKLAQLAAAQAKRGGTKYQINPVTGARMALPGEGGVHVVHSKEEFDTVPEGEFFITTGMTEPVQKLVGGTMGGAGG
jgi:hypothetical protein